jgi:hypothetical protein
MTKEESRRTPKRSGALPPARRERFEGEASK